MQQELYITGTGQRIAVHHCSVCKGKNCCIHNPSDHPLHNAPTHWREDRRIMERICKHGIGHPDPDHLAHTGNEFDGVHGCDGCCTTYITKEVPSNPT